MSNTIIVTVDVNPVSINDKAGRFMLKIFCFSGSTITTSLGRRKYASEDKILLS